MGNLFAHVIGFTNIDGKGQEGLELSREDSLHGADGAKVVLRDNKGNIVDSLDSPRNSDPKNGQDMVLSLDQRAFFLHLRYGFSIAESNQITVFLDAVFINRHFDIAVGNRADVVPVAADAAACGRSRLTGAQEQGCR